MIIANINAFWQPIFIGLVLLGAVVLDVVLLRVSSQRRTHGGLDAQSRARGGRRRGA